MINRTPGCAETAELQGYPISVEGNPGGKYFLKILGRSWQMEKVVAMSIIEALDEAIAPKQAVLRSEGDLHDAMVGSRWIGDQGADYKLTKRGWRFRWPSDSDWAECADYRPARVAYPLKSIESD